MPVNTRKSYFFALVFLLFLIFFQSCKEEKSVSPNLTQENKVNTTVYEGITDLLPGDIIVKPNLNFLPGSAFVPNGSGFGHAALVIKGNSHNNIDSLLAGARIVESIAKDVPVAFQVREISAFIWDRNPSFSNTNFGNKYKGRRYRLRLQLSQSAIDSIIDFALAQKGDLSSWNAAKRFPDHLFSDSLVQLGVRKNWADNATWYCSLLVWQSVFFVTGIDLDPNGGYMVYPNDLIKSRYFDYEQSGDYGRQRF
ncbi:MAG: hypothetical protein Q8J88_06825 [Bacteroidales bacterium]|nr:hypothetical protein [Bacteroidales bacterium]